MSDNEPPEFLKGGPALGADGKLEGRLSRIEADGPPPDNSVQLELEVRPPKRPDGEPTAYREPTLLPSQRLGLRLIAVALAAGVALLVAGLATSRPSRPGEVVRSNTFLDSLLAQGAPHAVVIISEPPGATVKIAGQAVGVTPWAGDNLWADDTPVVLELPGFKPWKGTLSGGREVHLKARLTK